MKISQVIIGLASGALGFGSQSVDLSEVMPPEPNCSHYEEFMTEKPKPKVPVYDYGSHEADWDDLQWLAKTLYSERKTSVPKVKEELRAIGAVVLNRMKRDNMTLKQVVTKKNQFSGVRSKKRGWYEDVPTKVHYEIAAELLRDGANEKYKDYMYFCNLSIVSKQKNKTNFRFFQSLKKLKTFPQPAPKKGRHTFYSE